MGGYGLLRFNLPLYPQGAEDWAPVIIVLSIIGILYGAFVALVQPDMKKLIAYSSVSHMGFVTLGIFIMNLQGMEGAMMVMLAHGFNTGALFLIVGVIYERGHTRLIDAFGGLASRMGIWAGLFMVFMFASIGLPGFSGFIGEFLVALGTWDYNPWAAAFAFSVVIFAAWYMLQMYQRVVFGRAWGQAPDPGDSALTPAEQREISRTGGHHSGVEHGTYDTDEHGGLDVNPHPVSGGDHHDAHAATGDTGGYPTHEGQLDSSRWPDMTSREMLVIVPLGILTLVAGVYPKPLFDILEPSLLAVLEGAARVVGN
jgi:NADH-quinone oxidoreductase subunit M